MQKYIGDKDSDVLLKQIVTNKNWAIYSIVALILTVPVLSEMNLNLIISFHFYLALGFFIVILNTLLSGFILGVLSYAVMCFMLPLLFVFSNFNRAIDYVLFVKVSLFVIAMIFVINALRCYMARLIKGVLHHDQQLREAEEKLLIMLLECDAEGNIRSIQENIVETFCISKNDNIFSAFNFEQKDHEKLKLIRKSNSKRISFEKEILVGGSTRYVDFNITGLYGSDGESRGYLINIRDFTVEKVITNELKEITNNMSDIFLKTDLHNEVNYVTHSIKYLGYLDKDFIGQKISQFILDIDQELFEVACNNAKELYLNSYIHARMIKKHVGIIWIGIKIDPYFERDELTGLLFTIRDINEMKEAQLGIKESENKLRTIIDNISDAILLFNYEKDLGPGIITDTNATFEKLFGYNKEEILGQNPLMMLPEEEKDYFYESYMKIHSEENINFETEVLTTDGRRISTDISVKTFLLGGKKRAITTIRDITWKKETEREKELYNKIVEYDRLKTEFFANISHEIRTPVNLIFSALQLLDMHIDSSDIEDKVGLKKYSKVIKQNSFRLIKLVNNFLDLTRINAGYVDLKLRNINIIELVENVVMSVAGHTEEKGIELIFDTDYEEMIIACDEEKIERIMLNLLSNATKYTSSGDKIIVYIHCNEKNVTIGVRDTGVGIPKDKMDIIFERFRQVDRLLTRTKEGSGIGLSIVKALVEMHSGTIEVNKEYLEGSEFIVTLPVRVLSQEEDEAELLPITGTNSAQKVKIEFSDIDSF